ncbi:hypothetical protein OS188_09285 [Xanthomarina sp. F1114]|uniref:hypothetical protein n=1 Tax=Xanthomarina sp. F1114 TaxID=2996019 RepID=UPI00225E6737|nr:hypothetical protein [Xanthomarina sp. F1114]MCX7548145.1 hypothetical protein [Xanthomarina sp. F1114]
MIIQKKNYRLPVALLIFGVIFCVISAFMSLNSTETWFARSGAVLSFVSVAIQFILSNLKKAEIENLFKTDLGLREKFDVVKEKDTLHDFISVSSTITGLIGTIIWGYGDLLF